MSGRLAGLVWESDLPRRLKPYAAVYAGFAKHDGTSVHPSEARVAWMLDVSARSVQTAVGDLRRLGILRVVRVHSPTRPAVYLFDEAALPGRPPLVVAQLHLTFRPEHPKLASGVHPKPASGIEEFSTGVHTKLATEHPKLAASHPKLDVAHPKLASPDPSSDPSVDPSGDPSTPARSAPDFSAPAKTEHRAPAQATIGPLDVSAPPARAAPQWDRLKAAFEAGLKLAKDRKAQSG